MKIAPHCHPCTEEGLAVLVTIEDLATHIQEEIAEDTQTEAEAAIRDASAAVNHAAGRSGDSEWDAQTVPGIAKAICLRVATRILKNPEQRTAYNGPEGLSYSGSPTRILTQEERDDLAIFARRSPGVICMPIYQN